MTIQIIRRDFQFEEDPYLPLEDVTEPRNTRYWQDKDGQKWRSFGTMCWFTNLDIKKRHENLILYKKHTVKDNPKFNNYNAINVDKVADIPVNYDGMIGVPITFLNKHNPDQFEIIDSNDIRSSPQVPFKDHGLIKDKDGTVVGESKPKYVRIVIKHKRRQHK